MSEKTNKELTEMLEEKGFKLPQTRNLNMLHILSAHLPYDLACDFRKIGRILSTYKNMPVAFYSNQSTGVHSGWVMYKGTTYKGLIEWAKSKDFDIKNEDIIVDDLIKLFNYLIEFDVEEKYQYIIFN